MCSSAINSSSSVSNSTQHDLLRGSSRTSLNTQGRDADVADRRPTVSCPYCNAPAELVRGDVIYRGRPELHAKRFWRCAPCGAHVGCHAPNRRFGYDGTQPLGRLANASLRKAKARAHALFDPFWKSGRMSRVDAYTWLARELRIDVEACHIGEFDEAMCNRVEEICKRWMFGAGPG